MVAKVEHHPRELFPRVGFIVTNFDPAEPGGGWVVGKEVEITIDVEGIRA